MVLIYCDERKRARNQFGRRPSTTSGSGQNGARQRIIIIIIIYNTIYPPCTPRLFSLSPSHAPRRRRRRESVIRNHKNPVHNAAAVSVFITLYVRFFCICVSRIYYNILYICMCICRKIQKGENSRVWVFIHNMYIYMSILYNMYINGLNKNNRCSMFILYIYVYIYKYGLYRLIPHILSVFKKSRARRLFQYWESIISDTTILLYLPTIVRVDEMLVKRCTLQTNNTRIYSRIEKKVPI